MMPFQQQQPTSHRSIPQFGFGFPLQRQPLPMNLQPYGLGPMDMQMNWQGGFVNGQHMPIQPPPFMYPLDSMRCTESSFEKNQVQSVPMMNRGPLVTPRGQRRGILKQPGQSNTPTQRRSVHFMPRQWQTNTSNNPERRPITGPYRGNRSKKTPEKARLDTIRRRERRQKNRAAARSDNSKDFILPNDNRFMLLSETDEGEETDDSDQTDSEVENEQQTMKNDQRKNRQVNTTTEVPVNSEHVVLNKSKQTNNKKRGNNQQQSTVLNLETEEGDIFLKENNHENEELPSNKKGKQRTKLYLQSFKVRAYLQGRLNNDRKMKLEFKDVFNEVCGYARNTIEAYDELIKNNYEVQVWERFYELGKKDHWAKEVVNITHTREAKGNTKLCEKKISHFTSLCFDANNTITRNMREFSSDPSIPSATAVVKKAHDVMLDYIKEMTQGLAKMSINRIHRASIEKDEWDALKAFENVASEQQKMYAKTYCKPALKNYNKKKTNLDLIAAHISNDIIPKILPQYDFDLPMDKFSLSSEQAKENKESIAKLSRDFRLKATELYLKIATEEFDFQKERLDQLLSDFPQDREVSPLSQTGADNEKDNDDDDDSNGDVFTQRPLLQRKDRTVTCISSKMYARYIEIALKRALLETEREVHFLVEHSVEETPFGIQEARDLNPVLRKDFVLQA